MKDKRETVRKYYQVTNDNVDFSKIFRENIYKYTGLKNMTLASISDISDIPQGTLNSFLRGLSNDMKISNAVKIAKALEVSVDELIGAETLPKQTIESIEMCRNLPENDLYLVRWFIKYLTDLNKNTKSNERRVSVMILGIDNNGDLKVTSEYEKVEITELTEPLKSKVFFGIKFNCDNYMPHYAPNEILLIANDRPPTLVENCVIRKGKYLFIAKQHAENGIKKYYSIRDGKYRLDETDIDEVVGYIAATKK